MESKKRAKVILIVTACLILIGLIYFIVAAMLNARERIVVDSVPKDLTLKMDGKKVKSVGAIGVQPGTYTLEGSRTGFATKKVTVTVKEGETKNVSMFLDPNSATGDDWLSDEKNTDQIVKREAKKGQEHDEATQKAIKSNALITELPYIGPGYSWRIDYGAALPGAKFPDQPTIYISGKTQDDRESALIWLRSGGYNPDNMNIVQQDMPQSQ